MGQDSSVPKSNGGKPYDALACQMYCETDPECSFFTYYQESKDCWLLGSKAVRMPNVDGAVSGPEDCSHMQSGVVAAEPNPLKEYPDVQVIAQRTVADANDTLVDTAEGSRFPMNWVLGLDSCT